MPGKRSQMGFYVIPTTAEHKEKQINLRDVSCFCFDMSTTSRNISSQTFNEIQEFEPQVGVEFEFVVHGLLLTSIGIAGLFANIICLIILCQPSLRRGQGSVNVILVSMAAIDIVVVICAILMCGFPGLTNYILTNSRGENQPREENGESRSALLDAIILSFPYTTPYIYPLGLTAQTASVYLTVSITVERYIVVCHPLKARSLCTPKRTRFAVFMVIAFSIIYNVTRFFEYRHETYEIPQEFVEIENGSPGVSAENNFSMVQNKTITRLQTTSLRMNQIYVEVYINWMYLMIMYVVPFLLLLVLNSCIGLEINRARIRRNKMGRRHDVSVRITTSTTDGVGGISVGPIRNTCSNKSLNNCGKDRKLRDKEEKEQHNLSLMLMFVVMVFMLCNVLAMVSNILEAFKVSAAAMTQISNLLVTLNSSVNLFIYCGFGGKFRRELKRLFCQLLSTKKDDCEGPTQTRPDVRMRGDFGDRTEDDYNRIESTVEGGSFYTKNQLKENVSRSFESPTMSISSQKWHNVQFSIVEIFKTPAENTAINMQNSFELTVLNSPHETVKYSRNSKSSNGCVLRRDIVNSTQIDLKSVSDISNEEKDETKFFNYNWIRESYHNGSQKLEEPFFKCEREHLV